MLFDPESVAVVGATPKKGKVGYAIINNLKHFRGKVYAINPKYEEVLGFPCYPSILEAPPVDLAVIAVPAKVVNPVLEQCGEKGVKYAVVITAGFRETGREGAKLEEELVRICRKYGIKLVGPNCLGIINTHNGLNATFASTQPKPGNIAFLSQSGAFIIAVMEYFRNVNEGFSKIVSMGNKAVLDEADIMEMLRGDPYTDVIMLYIEGIGDGRKFMEVAERVGRAKPVVAMKSGKTDAGAKAASSHTGSIAGSYQACLAAFRQSGVIPAESPEDLFDVAKIFAKYRDVEGGVAVVTNSGGPGVMAADAIEAYGLKMASFSRETIEKLKEILPAGANVYNPVDVLGDSDAERYIKAIECVANDENVGAIIAITVPTARLSFEEAARFSIDKPYVLCFMGWEKSDFFDPVRAVRALSALYRYSEFRRRGEKTYREFSFDRKRIEEAMMSINPFDILKAVGIPTPKYGVAKTAEEALKVADEIGYPVAMKVLGDIVHKTDVGCVKLNIEREEVKKAFVEIIANAERLGNVRIDGVLIQEMVKGGREVIVGMKRDASFGPLIMFGLGGIYVEVFKDVTFRIAPVSEEDATDMIREVKAYKLLKGVRGEKPSDVKAIAEVIMKMSQLSLEFPEIMEMEINPLRVFEKGCSALDFKISFRKFS